MTPQQRITAKDWVRKFEDLYFKQPKAIDIGEISIYLLQVAHILHPYYKILQDGNMLLGIGTQFIDNGVIVIGIGDWFAINPNCETNTNLVIRIL
jgi:hypothetical protein